MCSEYEQLQRGLLKASTDGADTSDVILHINAHLEYLSVERRTYRLKTELTKTEPHDYLSLSIDGADLKRYQFPHFCTSTNDQSEHGLSVHLIVVLEHAAVNPLHLFNMIDNHETGSYHIVEALHRIVINIASAKRLLNRLFLQLYNCTREKNNNYFMPYVEYLVCQGVFRTIEVGIFPLITPTRTSIRRSVAHRAAYIVMTFLCYMTCTESWINAATTERQRPK